MVHIADGILSPEIWIISLILTCFLLFYTLSKIKVEDISKISLIASAVFVASLLHIPIGPSSVHLIFAGLAGILLGRGAFPAVFLAVLLQAFLFQHGGITTIGVNSLTIGLPALISYSIFRFVVKRTSWEHKYELGGSLAGGIAILLAVIITSVFLIMTGEEFIGLVVLLIGSHIPVIIIETVLVGGIAGFLHKVKPEMLAEVNI
jgi:cobalt/nickel transport system permease protein